jgi:flagella basal body P-ring formation protein FlgA
MTLGRCSLTTVISFDMIKWLLILILVPFALIAQEQNTVRVVSGQEVQDAIIQRLASVGEISAPNVLPEKQFYACDAPLVVEPAFGGWRSVKVRCPSPVTWSILVRAQVQGAIARIPEVTQGYASQAVFLRRPLLGGDRIQVDDLELRPIAPLSSSSVYDVLEDVVGRVLKQSLSPSVPIMPRHLERVWAVNLGDVVSMRVVSGGTEIVTFGIALESGQIGDNIKIENRNSGRELIGYIDPEGIVQIFF